MLDSQVDGYKVKITDLARQLNMFVASLKRQRKDISDHKSTFREDRVEYAVETVTPETLFISTEELAWLAS
jgi:hypothetical protein